MTPPTDNPTGRGLMAEISALKQENDALRQEAADWRSAKYVAEQKETAVNLALNDMRAERDAFRTLPAEIAGLLARFKFESSPHDSADDTIRRLTFVLTRFDEIVAERDALLKVREAAEYILAEYDSCDEYNREGRSKELVDGILRNVVRKMKGGA